MRCLGPLTLLIPLRRLDDVVRVRAVRRHRDVIAVHTEIAGVLVQGLQRRYVRRPLHNLN